MTLTIHTGTAGIGAQTLLALSSHNPSKIFFTGRNSNAASNPIQQTQIPADTLCFIPCDHNSLSSVQHAAQRILAKTDRIDVLICNAGIMAGPPGVTQDGYERQFGINFLAHALLIRLLLPTLSSTSSLHGDARIVLLTCLSFQHAPQPHGIVFETLKSSQQDGDAYIGFQPKNKRYAQSKLALILYGKQLARRYPSITTLSIHPGVCNTGLVCGLPFWEKMLFKLWVKAGMLGDEGSAEEASWNVCWGATAEKGRAMVSGGIYEPVGVSVAETEHSTDEVLGEKLWEWTEEQLERWL